MARLSYRIKSTDNATTLPGRTFFPKGTYISQAPKLPTSNYYNSERYRTPYAQGTGTQASGLSGQMGAPFAMAPVNSPTYNLIQSMGNRNIFGGVGNAPYGPIAPTVQAPPLGQATAFQNLVNPYYQNQVRYGTGTTDDSWYRPVAQPSAVPAAPPLQPGQYVNVAGQVQQGATPYGTNAYGERLDAGGNVWDPSTATRDIYGGKFIQKGEVRWERNKVGRLQKVKYLGGGKKRVVAGGKKQSRGGGGDEEPAEPVYQQPVQQPVYQPPPVQQVIPQPSIANMFVSFRS